MKRVLVLALVLVSFALGGCTLDSLFSGLVNAPPEAVIDAKPCHGDAPLTIHVDAGFSHDDHGISEYYWDFGDPHDAAPLSTTTATHTYRYPGAYVVKLTVVDERGALSSQKVEVVVQNPPPLTSFTISPASVYVGDAVHFDASATYDQNGEVASLAWDLGDGAKSTGQKVDHSYAKAGYFVITLTATDNEGATSTLRHDVTVQQRAGGSGGGGGGCGGGGGGCGGGGDVPLAVITGLPSCSGATIGSVIHFDGSYSHAAEGSTIASYDWAFGDGSTGNGALADHAYNHQGYYMVTLTVTDSGGLKSTAAGSVSVGGSCTQQPSL